MQNLLEKGTGGVVGRCLASIARCQAFDLASHHLLELICRYFRLEVSGLGHVPAQGPAIIIANHSGFAGADAIVLSHLIHARLGRQPRIMAHRAYFEASSALRLLCRTLGLREAHVATAVETLRHGNLLIVFPEGEAGNFKSSLSRYHLQPFHTGFIRAALEAGTPVIPCVIVGAEESHLSLGNINLTRYVKGLRIPLPLNLFPLPAKWKIKFLKPIRPATLARRRAGPRDPMSEAAEQMRLRLQGALDLQLKSRKYVYSGIIG